MLGGHIGDGMLLAKERWAQLFAFDLDETTWRDLFSKYKPGEVLQGIQMMRKTVDPRPERVYARFQQMLERISPAPYGFQ